MRPGGSKQKGNNWERATGVALSLWLTDGQRSDLLARTVLSGGQHTGSKGERGIPGDLMANHPAAYEFMSLFSIECKHRASIGLDRYLWDTAGTSFLAQTYALANTQAIKLGLSPLVIAKQNRCPAVVLMSYHTGMAARDTAIQQFRFHALHNNTVVLVPMEYFVKIPPKPFLEIVKRRWLRHG